jgi:hypothetical protein
MARKQNNPAARERKQKIVVAVGFVLLAGLMVIQGPKLLDAFGGGSDSSAAPAASATPEATPAAGSENGGAAAPATPVRVKAPKSAQAQLAGVIIVPEQPVQPGDGQLGSFSRFDSKDPFVQHVKDELVTATAAPASQPAQSAQAQQAAKQQQGKAGTPGGMVVGSNAAPEAMPTMAMLKVNGKLVTLESGKRFPRGDGAFLLKTLKRGSVGIAVADGEFAGGGVLTLRLGRKVTLINTATGARYVVQLVLLGNEENVTRFSTK